MTTGEIRKYQMLVRVRDFGDAHRDLFPARSVTGKLFAAVAAAADALQQHQTTELAGRGGEQDGALSKAAARTALRRQVQAIAKTAQAAEAPGLTGKFRASLACSDERLLAQARMFLIEAKPLEEAFVAHDLPPDFLKSLRAAIDAFEQAMRERASGRDQRIAARASIDGVMEEGLRAVRRLSGLVPNKLEDRAIVALWNAARRVVYGRVNNGEAAAPETPSPSTGQSDTAKPAA
jgi:hypothetical protein